MFSETFLILMPLSTFIDKILSTGIKFIRFDLQIMLDFGMMKCINYRNVTQVCNVHGLGLGIILDLKVTTSGKNLTRFFARS